MAAFLLCLPPSLPGLIWGLSTSSGLHAPRSSSSVGSGASSHDELWIGPPTQTKSSFHQFLNNFSSEASKKPLFILFSLFSFFTFFSSPSLLFCLSLCFSVQEFPCIIKQLPDLHIIKVCNIWKSVHVFKILILMNTIIASKK